MSNIQNKENPANYKYGSYINFKAIKDYCIKRKINDDYIKPQHCILLAFMVESYYKASKMPSIEINGTRYIMMNSNYILNNLIYLRVKERSLKYYISDLKKSKIINIHVENKKDRYVSIDSVLVNLYYNNDHTFKSTNYLAKNQPDLWKGFVSDWQPYFKTTEDFKRFIDGFNDTRDIDEMPYNSKEIYDHLINAVKYKIYGKKYNG
jgi:hypothetical protein